MRHWLSISVRRLRHVLDCTVTMRSSDVAKVLAQDLFMTKAHVGRNQQVSWL